jgi:hypothetical protein
MLLRILLALLKTAVPFSPTPGAVGAEGCVAGVGGDQPVVVGVLGLRPVSAAETGCSAAPWPACWAGVYERQLAATGLGRSVGRGAFVCHLRRERSHAQGARQQLGTLEQVGGAGRVARVVACQ